MVALTHNAPVYRTADIRAIEGSAAAALPQPGLMERAELAAARKRLSNVERRGARD